MKYIVTILDLDPLMVYIDLMDGRGCLYNPRAVHINFPQAFTMNFSIPTSDQIGTKMEKIARICAIIIVFVYVLLRDIFNLLHSGVTNLAQIAYDSGYTTGRWIHQLNDKLSNTFTALLGVQRPTPAPAFYHPMAEIAQELECLTVVRLKELNNTKKKYKKQQLIDMTLALV